MKCKCPECSHEFETGTSENVLTLRESILAFLANGAADLKTIAAGVLAAGFMTKSNKFSNTVRVQLYRLEDDRKVEEANGIFSLNQFS